MQIAFMLPTAYPCSYENFNYASVTVGVAVLVVCLAWYFPRYGARHAFRGGVRQVDYIRSGRVSAPPAAHWPTAPPAGKLSLSGHNRLVLDHRGKTGHSGSHLAQDSGQVHCFLYYNLENNSSVTNLYMSKHWTCEK